MAKKYIDFMFFSLCFAGLFIFFTYVHPLIPYDGDDWFYLSPVRRHAFPVWGSLNPSKVLPETVMPFCGYLAAYFVKPIVGDYVSSITGCVAFIISIAITIYFCAFYRLIVKKFMLPQKSSLLIVFLLFLLHFMIFQTDQFNNIHMFYSANLTCYFHYGLPALVNSVLVLYLLSFDDFLTVDITKSGIFILAIFLAIFSNIFHSVILIACIFVRLVSSYLKNTIKNKHGFFSAVRIIEFVHKNICWFIVMAVWVISLIFEANGVRASQIGHSIFTLPVKQTLLYLCGLVKQVSIGFCVVLFITLWSSRVFYIKSKNKEQIDCMFCNVLMQNLFCLLVALIYVVIISAKSFPNYVANANVAFSFLFYLFVILCFSIAYVFQKRPTILSWLPLICFIITVFTINSYRHFRENNICNIAPYKCVLVDQALINQIVKADKNAKSEMTLMVPKGDNHDNWPHPLYMGKAISRTLFAHGIIHNIIEITIKPDASMNERYHLDYSK